MTTPRTRRPPRSYRSGRLLGLLEHDFPGHSLELSSPGKGRMVPPGGGIVIEVEERVDRRFLGHTEIARFMVEAPSAMRSGARFHLRHTGNFKRTGAEVVLDSGADGDRVVVARILAAPAVAVPALALDFTSFDIERSDGVWTVVVELMGASFVSLAMPPMRSYVRLHPDQRDALVEVLEAMATQLAHH